MKPVISRLLLVGAMTSAMVALGGGTAIACSCALLTPAELMTEAHGAFVGTLVDRQSDAARPLVDSDEEVGWVFEIETVYKGDLSSPIVVMSSTSSAGCGLEMPPGTTIGIFAYHYDGAWHSGSCSTIDPTTLEQAGFAPIDFSVASTGEATSAARWALLGVASAGLGAVVWNRVTRRRRAVIG